MIFYVSPMITTQKIPIEVIQKKKRKELKPINTKRKEKERKETQRQ